MYTSSAQSQACLVTITSPILSTSFSHSHGGKAAVSGTMAILERTPPRTLHHDSRPSDHNDVSATREKLQRTSTIERLTASVTKDSEKTFVFPSLEDMAAPVRERLHQLAQQNTATKAPSDSRRSTPLAMTAGNLSVSPTPPLHGAKGARTSRSPMSTSVKNRSLRVSEQEDKKTSVKSPMASKRNSNSVSTAATTIRQGSVAAESAAATSAVDQAFQEQIERAIASGENPFMDRRRAAMRDDGETSSLSPFVNGNACQHDSLQSAANQIASTSRITLQSIDETYQQQQQHPAHRNSTYDTRSTNTMARRSFLADSENSYLKTTPPKPATSTSMANVLTPPRKLTNPSNSLHQQPKRAHSPPIEVFTPRRKTISSGDGAQFVSIAQQEELHKLRNELRELKASLRSAQLNEECSVRDANVYKAELEKEQCQLRELHNEMERTMAENGVLDVTLQQTRWDSASTALHDRMTHEEYKRQREIESIIARNEITYLNARRLEAQEEVELVKGKQEYCGREWQDELTALQTELDEVRTEKKQLNVRIKQQDRQIADVQEQVESLQQDVERESSRRKEIATRESSLRGEVDELREVVARESALRKQVAELRSSLAATNAEMEKKNTRLVQLEEQALSAAETRSQQQAADKRQSARAASRRAMQEEVESSFVEQQRESHSSYRSPSPPPQPKKSSGKITQKEKAVISEKRGKRQQLTKSSSSATSKKRAADKQKSDHQDEEGDALDAHNDRRSEDDEDELKFVQENHQPQHDDAPHGSKSAAMVKTATSIVPSKKASSNSVLARTASMATGKTRQEKKQKREPSGEGETSASSAAASANAPKRQSERSKAMAASSTKQQPAYDETMKTPLLPTKRTRAALNMKEANVDDEDEDEQDEPSGAHEMAKLARSTAAPPTNADATLATPMVHTIEPQKKKKRKLLKAGSNVAGDFLTWKGDADGALAPQLNLPIELSPLKPGESGGVGAGATVLANKALRIGAGANVHASAAASMFGRK